MRLGRVTTVIISLIVQLSAKFVRSEPISIYINQEAKTPNYVFVNFYNDTFQRLYNCMTEKNSQQCFAQAVFETERPPFPGVNVKVINVRSTGKHQQVQSSFTCLYNQQATALECTENTSQCGENTCTSFRLRSSPTCECVHLIWQNTKEKLVFDNNTDNIEFCKNDCTETTTAQSTASRSNESVTSLPSEQSSDATTSASNSTSIAISSRDESSNNVPVIVGVVLGVFFIAAIVIVFGFLYRRKKQTKRQVSNKGINSSPTNSYKGGPAQSSATNIPDVLNTLPSSSHGSETNRESEDGYYTIDKVYGLNSYENELNTVSSKVSQRPKEGVLSSCDAKKHKNELTRVSPDTLHTYESDAVNSEMSHARDGDYFTIDTEDDDGAKYKPIERVLNSRDVNKYTNELRFSTQISHIYEGDAGNSEMSHAIEGDYFTIDSENDDGAKYKPIESVLNSRGVNKYTNELSFPPQISDIYESDAVKSELLHAPEEEYFTLETENDFGEDDTTVDEEQTADGGYSLAKDVDIIDEAPVVDVIDVSPPPKNIYSKFGDNDNTDMKNPYDKLLEKHQILKTTMTTRRADDSTALSEK